MSLLFSNDLLSAYVTEVVKSFNSLTRSRYLGRTALQKLIYFCKAVGVPIPCSFEIYNFGPYSEEVTRSATALLADEALQDRSSTGAYSSYTVGTNANEFSEEFMDDVARYRPTIDSVVKILGPCNPAMLELVATLHFVNARLKGISGRKPPKESVIAEFRSIKGNKFSEEKMDFWYQWLEQSRLL